MIAFARRFRFLLLVLLGFGSVTSADMPAKMVFSRVLADAEAKPLGGMNSIVQDAQGFIWFAGEAGLGRFDGHQLRFFPADIDSPYALNSNYIRDLLVDHDGVLWIATDAGLCRYNAPLDRFNCRVTGGVIAQPLKTEAVNTLALATDNTLYIGGVGGLYQFDPGRQHLSYIAPPPELASATSKSIIALDVDSRGIVWVATTQHGLMQFDPSRATETSATMTTKPVWQQAGDKIKAVHVDHTDRLWLGTYGGGVFVLDAARKRFTHFQADANSGLSSNVVWDIFEDSRGTVWLAVDQGGLVRYYEHERQFRAQRANLADPFSLQSDQVRSIFEDRNGDLWLGLFPYGVNFFNRTTSEIYNFRHDPGDPHSLSHTSVLSIHQCDSGDIWLGTEDGLNLFRPQQGQFQRFRKPDYQLPAKAVLSIEQLDEHTLWLGTWSGGLAEFDRAKQTFRAINTTPQDEPTAANSLFIWDILRDADGDMWLGTEFNGAVHYDRDTGRFTYHRARSNDPTSLASDFVWSITQTRSGDYFFGTQSGLSRTADAGASFTTTAVASPVAREDRSDRILAVFQSSQDWLWVATQDKGVFVIATNGEFIRHLGLAEGLPSLTVSGFVEDDAGHIWAGTINGLARIDPLSWQVSVLNSDNGLVGNNFNRNAFLKDNSGRLYFGGADGLSVFHPARLEQDQVEFDVLVTGILVHNSPVIVGAPESPVATATTMQPQVQLDHRDSMVTFEFSALNYRKAAAMVYAYRLDGFDQQWHHIGKNYSATYTNLPPGDYKFRVMASAGNGQWQESQPLQVTMRPAPWLSFWALLIYAVTLLGLGALVASHLKLRIKTDVYKALSVKDALTGLLNRMGVMQQAHALFGSNVGRPLCLVFIDVDHFKRINDEQGHDAGDRILVEISQVIVSSVRQADIVGRWGGEEFILLCPGVHKEAIGSIIEKVRLSVAEHTFEQQYKPLKVTISLGVAYVQPGESFESALKRADLALYKAKEQGRNCAVMAEEVG